MIPDHGDPDRHGKRKRPADDTVNSLRCELEAERRKYRQLRTRFAHFKKVLHQVVETEFTTSVAFFDPTTDPALLGSLELDLSTTIQFGGQQFVLR